MHARWVPPSMTALRGSDPYHGPPGGEEPPRWHSLRWIVLGIGVAFVGLAVLVLLFVLYPASFGLGSSNYPGRFGAFGGAFLLFFLLVVGFFIVRVAFWSARAGRHRQGWGPGTGPGYGPNRPAMVARMRYARGEITREQYDQIIQDLSRRPGVP